MTYPDNFNYITPEQAAAMEVHKGKTHVAYYKKLARRKGRCENCENDVWKLGVGGLCFSCTTGETDASNDYELKGK